MGEAGLLLRETPLLLPQNRDRSAYDGFVSVQDTDYRLRIVLPPDRRLKHANLQCCGKLKRLLHPYQQVLKQRLQHSSDLVTFMVELKTILEAAVRNRRDARPSPPPQYYARLIAEMEILGWDKLVFVDTDFCTLKLGAVDQSGRQHAVTVILKPGYPVEPPETSADLPFPLTISWTQQSTLSSVYSQFGTALESLEDFWTIVDEIDEKTWVLEPEKPSRGDTMRRIAIGNNVSIKLEIDPRHPRMLPECCLLGAEHMVTPLRSKLNTNMHLWNPESSVLQNMKDVLEMEFPSPTSHEKASFSTECGICYSYRLATSIPDQVCNDPRCGQPFHQECLYEWLRGLPSSRQSFSLLFGECPYCSKPITVKMSTQKV